MSKIFFFIVFGIFTAIATPSAFAIFGDTYGQRHEDARREQEKIDQIIRDERARLQKIDDENRKHEDRQRREEEERKFWESRGG